MKRYLINVCSNQYVCCLSKNWKRLFIIYIPVSHTRKPTPWIIPKRVQRC